MTRTNFSSLRNLQPPQRASPAQRLSFVFLSFYLHVQSFCREIDSHVAPVGAPEATGGGELSDIMSAAWGYSVPAQSP